MKNQLIVRNLGQREYQSVWLDMQQFTANRDESTADELWFVEHPPVYTLGVGGKEKHVLDAHNIPVVRSNRGGQVTYHGPGQVVMYVLLDIKRKKINVRQLVSMLEETVIELLGKQNIAAEARKDAPGVYVDGEKVAALGLRVSRGCSYHGLALNVDMDLAPFNWINPCGYEGLRATQLANLGFSGSMLQVRVQLQDIFADKAGYVLREVEA